MNEIVTDPSQETAPEEIHYSEDQSLEFDDYLRTHDFVNAPQNDLSVLTKDKVLFSGWHTPCHAVLARTQDGEFQIFHIQPNKLSSSLLTFKQKQAMEALASRHCSAIAVFSDRSWWGFADRSELNDYKIELEKEIKVNTSNWWRVLYDPKTNELWVDIKDKKTLIKYKGFKSDESL